MRPFGSSASSKTVALTVPVMVTADWRLRRPALSMACVDQILTAVDDGLGLKWMAPVPAPPDASVVYAAVGPNGVREISSMLSREFCGIGKSSAWRSAGRVYVNSVCVARRLAPRFAGAWIGTWSGASWHVMLTVRLRS